jgi:hypothetical protein
MSRNCQVCRHPERLRIELLRASGVSLDALAAKFAVSRDSVWRHWRGHVSGEMKSKFLGGPADLAALGEKTAVEGDSVLDHLRMCRMVLTAHLAAMSEAGDARGAAFVAGQLRLVLESIAKVTGELGEMARNHLTITNSVVLNEHEFVRLQATLLKALGPFPDARAAVVQALRALDADSTPAANSAPMAAIPTVVEQHDQQQ